MLVSSEGDYTTMVASAVKSKSLHIVNITVGELEVDNNADKENEEAVGDVWQKKDGNKKVCICKYLASSLI